MKEGSAMPILRESASGLEFPEGPVWLSDGSVLVVEIIGGHLSRVAPDGKVTRVARTGNGPNGAAIGPDGKCYLCVNGGSIWHKEETHTRALGHVPDGVGCIERVDLATGKCERLYTETTNGKLGAPNDLVFDRHGGFWFTDIGKISPRGRGHGGVYYAKPDGSFISEVIYPLITPNGIALSPDETKLYVAETMTGRIWSFDIVEPGKVEKKSFPSLNGGTLLAALPGHQPVDSMAVDSAGNICVGTLLNGGITVISPDGSSIEHVPLPDVYVTNVCFGGPDLRTAFATLSHTGRLVALDWPRPGHPLNFSI